MNDNEIIKKAEEIVGDSTNRMTVRKLFQIPQYKLNNIDIDVAKQIVESEQRILDYPYSIKRMKEAVSKWNNRLQFSPIKHYFFFHYYPKTIDGYNISSIYTEHENVQISNNMIYAFKEGEKQALFCYMVIKKLQHTFDSTDLKNLVFLPIPASSQQSSKIRWDNFSEVVCSKTGMLNGFQHVEIITDATPKHLGGYSKPTTTYDIDFFSNKKVILFDDIVTTGKNMKEWIQNLKGVRNEKGYWRNVNAEVIACMSLGKTTHHYHEKHPCEEEWEKWTKEDDIKDGLFYLWLLS